jgi:copper ion binding protein
MSTKTYTVEGMSCGHCVNAVTEEVSRIAGVHEVQVDLAAKSVTVTGDGVADTQIAAAVDEAGYTLVS